MTGSRGRLGLGGELDRRALHRDAADDEAVGVGVVKDALARAEQPLDQVAVAQLVVGDALHHVGMRGVVGAIEHLGLRRMIRPRGWPRREGEPARPACTPAWRGGS